jgi:hypothetical protein
MKITKLTPEQEKILPQFREEWLRWGISTDRADRQKAESAILKMRQRIGVDEKPIFVWVQSPLAGCLAIHFLGSDEFREGSRKFIQASLGDSLGDSLRDSLQVSLQVSLWDSLGDSLVDSLRASLWDSLVDSLRASLGDSLRASLGDSLWDSLQDSLQVSLRANLGDSLRDSLWASLWDSLQASPGYSLRAILWESYYGQQDSFWVAFYVFCRDIVGIRYDEEKSSDLDLWKDLCQSSGWWWCYRNYVIVCERPTVCRLDDNGVIHGEAGPAVAFADGWSVYAWHGTRIPREWIEEPETLTAHKALQEENTERRLAACQILGWDRIISELNAKTVDKDDDEMIGELLEVNLPGSGKEKFLRVLCGTGRRFCIPVEPTVRTAREANASSWGLESHEYHPEVRT